MSSKVRHISNILVLLILVWLFNLAWAHWMGQPIIYCTFANSSFVEGVKGIYSLGMITLVIATAIIFTKRLADGVSMIFLTMLFAGIPVFFKTLFNMGGACLS